MSDKNLTVCKANALIEAGYRLSLNEQRIILACIAQVDSREELLATSKFEIHAKDFAKRFNLCEEATYSELKEASKNLYSRSLTIYNPDPGQPELKKLETRWISSIGYMPDKGKLSLRFSLDILPYLGSLKGNFTKYELEHIGNMSSTYGIRLYELLMQWKNTGNREIEIDWLKQQFQLDNSYDRMFDLKKRVIDPAVKDINKHSNFQVSWTQRKTGRKVTHLIFEFSEKKPATPTKAKKDKATTKDKNTVDVFHGLTENQIKSFSSKLVNDQEFGSRYAKAGEDMNAFSKRIFNELHQVEQQLLYLPFLKKLGFKP